MTDQIKVSEVSAILREQLEGINTTIHLEEVGTVLQVTVLHVSTGWTMPKPMSCCNSTTEWKPS